MNHHLLKKCLIVSLLAYMVLPSIGLAQRSSQSALGEDNKQKAIPAPPPLIAPTGLMNQADLMLPPQQALEKEKAYKAQADDEYNRGDYRRALVSLQRAYLISKKARYIAMDPGRGGGLPRLAERPGKAGGPLPLLAERPGTAGALTETGREARDGRGAIRKS